MFSNSFLILFLFVVMPQTIMAITDLNSVPTTPKNDETEPARNAVQLSTTCSTVVDLQTKLVFSKVNSLFQINYVDYRKIMLPLGYKELIAAFFKNFLKNQQRVKRYFPDSTKVRL